MIFEYGVFGCLGILIILKGNKWVGLFMLSAATSSLFPFYTSASFFAFYAVFVGCLWYGMIVMTTSKDTCRHLMDAMCVAALFQVGWQSLQVMGIDPVYRYVGGGQPPPVGLLANVNETSAFLAFCFPAFLRGKWKYLIWVPVLGIIWTKASMGYVSLAAGVMFYTVVTYERQCFKAGLGFWLAFITVGTIALYFKFVDPPGMERIWVWKIGLEKFTQHWVLGSGIGHWKIIFKNPMVTGTRWMTAHNEFVQGLFEMGAVFGACITGYYIRLVRNYTKAMVIPATAIIIISVNAFGNFCFHIAPLAMMSLTWIAIADIYIKEKNKWGF